MKKLFFIILFLLICSKAEAATYYAINAGGNWTAGGTWSTVSAKDVTRVGGATAPTNADTCYLDDYSGSVTINAASVCLTLDMNTNGAYGGTLAFGTQTLTVSGLATLRGAMTSTSGTLSVAGGVTLAATPTGTFPALTLTATETLTSGGFTWSGELKLNITSTKTLVGNWINTGLVTITNTQTINKTTAETLTCNNGITSTGSSQGTATIIIGGGTWSAGLGSISNNLTFNCSTATVSGGVNYKTGTLTYTAGTITTTGSTLNLAASCTLDTDRGATKITWNNIDATTGITITLSSNLTCTGNLVLSAASLTFSGAYNISVGTLQADTSTARVLTLVASQTLTVTDAMYISGDVFSGVAYSVVSATPNTHTHLNYTGTAANCRVSYAVFTDIDASGSSQGIDNWYGGTLTNTTNINNRTSADIGGGGGGASFFTMGN